MEIDASVYNLINLLLKVILISLIISAPAILLTLEMYGYEKYKKWKNTEEKEHEKIILGRAKDIVKKDEELERQDNQIKSLAIDIELLQKRKKGLADELDLPVDDTEEEPEEIDIESMNIKQLHEVAKDKGIKMYSRMKKSVLVKKLKDM
jgi:hypothetical protein